MKSAFFIVLLCLPLSATNYTVKAGGGGSFTTLAACAAQMLANGSGVSDTCTVFSGTYTESFTIPAGSSGNLKIFNVNGSDTVSIVGDVTYNSFAQLNGNCPEVQGTVITTASCGFFLSRTASPTSDCITIPANTTQFQVLDVQLYACNSFTVPSTASFGHIKGLTVTYPETTVGVAGVGPGVRNSGSNHMLYENVDISHVSDAFANFAGLYNVIRNSQLHDTNIADCDGGAHSSNCHIDFMEVEPSVATGFDLFEGNKIWNHLGANSHVFLTQGDVCGGNCSQMIFRFNQTSHVGGGGLLDDLGGFTGDHLYNNTWGDLNQSNHGSGGISLDHKNASSGGSEINSIWYYSESLTNFNPFGCEDTSCSPFNHGFNLAFCNPACTSGASGLRGFQYGLGAWLTDTGNLLSDPLFVGYSASVLGDMHLQSGSPARNAGTFETTVNGSIASSTALVVADAGYFQDGGGITGMQADCIAVTTITNHICITAVNYSTNTLTLATPITATNGDSVWIYSVSDGTVVQTDTGVDMGALPFNNSNPAPALGMFADLGIN